MIEFRSTLRDDLYLLSSADEFTAYMAKMDAEIGYAVDHPDRPGRLGYPCFVYSVFQPHDTGRDEYKHIFLGPKDLARMCEMVGVNCDT